MNFAIITQTLGELWGSVQIQNLKDSLYTNSHKTLHTEALTLNDVLCCLILA